MFKPRNSRTPFLLGILTIAVVVIFSLARLVPRQHTASLSYATQASDPWTPAQVLQPADLAKELANPKSNKPLIVYVGFEGLYRAGHIPGAVFYGSASKPTGLDQLKKWAQNVPREQAIVIYCGCCPWSRCPNIRPAFKALREMGFTKLRALYLPTDLATDWAQKGFPTEKGK